MSKTSEPGPSVTSQLTPQLTPLMRQYHELKAGAHGALLFFRMGDFYELFGEDAVVASRVLDITLTSRDKTKENPIPMAGVPHHSAQGYIQKLLSSGYKVAIAEQLAEMTEDSSPGKELVKREIVRTFSPAIQFDGLGVESRLLATVFPGPLANQGILMALDPSTGEICYTDSKHSILTKIEMDRWLEDLPIVHFLKHPERSDWVPTGQNTLIEPLFEIRLTETRAREILMEEFRTTHLDAFLEDSALWIPLAELVQAVRKSQRMNLLGHLKTPRSLMLTRNLILGPKTARQLDLVSFDQEPSLYDSIQKTSTAMGTRRLRHWCLEPLADLPLLLERQGAVREISEKQSWAFSTRKKFQESYDLERLASRIATGLASPRDTIALAKSLRSIGETSWTDPWNSPWITSRSAILKTQLAVLETLISDTLIHQIDPAPFHSRDAGIFRSGKNADLDRLIEVTEKGHQILVEIEARERTATQIPSLKVKYNRVFGYYFEVTHAHAKQVPAHYQRKQTLVGAERFFTEELKKLEEELLSAESKRKSLEQKLFEGVVESWAKLIPNLSQVADTLADLDCALALSDLAQRPGWIFPSLDTSYTLSIEGGRHPMIDSSSFVPNSVKFSPTDGSTWIITGPNMGGKSTFLRQTALLVILAQMGAPIPAKSAQIGLVTSLFTRMGAHDALSKGQSTFMVEMSELAYLLRRADSRSLIVLDEIGRGTSTFDGMSVAWATLEFLNTQNFPRTLFATHYHELTELAGRYPSIHNVHVAAIGKKDAKAPKLQFLYEVRPGPANESFGIQVASLAGVPTSVIQRSWKVLDKLEKRNHSGNTTLADLGQLDLFARSGSAESSELNEGPNAPDPIPHPILGEISNLRIDEMTPLQALTTLHQLKESLNRAVVS